MYLSRSKRGLFRDGRSRYIRNTILQSHAIAYIHAHDTVRSLVIICATNPEPLELRINERPRYMRRKPSLFIAGHSVEERYGALGNR